MSTEVESTQEARSGILPERTRSGRSYSPRVDIQQTAEGLILEADMPGADAGSIVVNFDKEVLTIHAPVTPRQSDEVSFLLREYGVGDFYREFVIHEAIDPEKIEAHYGQGVLRLVLPIREAAKPRKISVQAH